MGLHHKLIAGGRSPAVASKARCLYRAFSSSGPSSLENKAPNEPLTAAQKPKGETAIFLASMENRANSSSPSSFPTNTSTARKPAATATNRGGAPQSQSASALSNVTQAYMRTNRNAPSPVELAAARRRADEVERMRHRQWQRGDVYAPHDLSRVEAWKWSQRGRPTRDVFDVLNLDPLAEYKNFPLLSEFTTEMGRIKSRRITGLRPVNQRKMAKAIRRAFGMGLMPRVHIHPEMLRRRGPWYRDG